MRNPAIWRLATLVLAATLAIVTMTPWQPPAPIQAAPTVNLMTTTELPPPSPVPGQFMPFGLDDLHSGFPTVTKLSDGRLRLMWRRGSAHASADGRIMTSVGDSSGRNWSEPQQVSVDGGGDIRDPHLGPSGLSTVDGEVFLTYFVSVNGAPTGARVARSTDGGETFGPSVRIDPNYPWAAISSPVIKVGGKLWTSFYARQTTNPAEAQSAYAAWSNDNGATWASVRIAIGAPGNDFQEPWTVAGANGSVVFIMRDGSWNSLATRSINASGAWSAVARNVLPNATGNSASVRAANGRIYLVYRDTVTRAAKLASSGDNGVSWLFERELMPRPAGSTSAIGMSYGHPIEVGAGQAGRIFCPVGMERSDTDSRLYLGWL